MRTMLPSAIGLLCAVTPFLPCQDYQPRPGDPVFAAKPGPGAIGGTERWVVHFQARPFSLGALRDEYRGGRDATKIATIVADLERRMTAHQKNFVADIEALGGKVVLQLWLVNACAIEIAPKNLATVRALDNVAYLQPDSLDKPLFIKTATNNSNHRSDAVNAKGATGRGVAIAISDSGHDSNMNGTGKPHVTYSDRGSSTKTRLLFNKKMGRMAADDIHGHGTGVASCAAGWKWSTSSADHGHAFDAKIAGYAVADDSLARSFASTRARAWQDVVKEAAKHNIKVGNNSYAGSPNPLDVLQKAGDTTALVADVLICTAAGNSGTDITASQVNLNGLTVGAVNENSKTLAGFSGRGWMTTGGDFPDMVANGVSSNMARRDNQSADYIANGTSFASPMVAGAAALIRAANPSLTAAETKAILLAATEASPGTSSRHVQGTGCGYLRDDVAYDIAINPHRFGRAKVTSKNSICNIPIRVKNGQLVQIAIAWHRMDVDKSDFSDLNLFLRRGSAVLADSRRGPNSEEFVRYRATRDEVLTIQVRAWAVRHTTEQEFAWASNIDCGAAQLRPCFTGPQFGNVLAGGADYNNDGYLDFAVGHQFATRGTNANAGFVMVFSGKDGKSLTNCGFGGCCAEARFGASLGMGDVNADGSADVLVGEPGFLQNNLRRGAITWLSGKDNSGRRFVVGSNIGLGERLTVAQYLDADGYADVVATDNFGRDLRAFSGRTRQLLWHVRPFPNSQNVVINAIATVGDVNGDGLDEIIIGMPTYSGNRGRMEIRSGRNGALLRSFTGQTVERLGASVAGLGDLDGDGVNDYMFGSPSHSSNRGNLGVQSGRSGRFLHILWGRGANQRFGYSASGAGGDVDGDGTPDFYVASQPTGSGARGLVDVYSGKDARLLRTTTGGSATFGQTVLGISSSGDKVPDMVVGEPGLNRAWLYDCAARDNPPGFDLFGKTCPGTAGRHPRIGRKGPMARVGGTVGLSLDAARASSLALLKLGIARRDLPLDALGMPGCVRYYLSSIVTLALPTNRFGQASLTLPIPNDGNLASKRLLWQWVVLDRGGNAFGLTMSNAAWTRIGAK